MNRSRLLLASFSKNNVATTFNTSHTNYGLSYRVMCRSFTTTDKKFTPGKSDTTPPRMKPVQLGQPAMEKSMQSTDNEDVNENLIGNNVSVEDQETMTKLPPAQPDEINGPRGKEPTRFGDWERKGRVSDF